MYFNSGAAVCVCVCARECRTYNFVLAILFFFPTQTRRHSISNYIYLYFVADSGTQTLCATQKKT